VSTFFTGSSAASPRPGPAATASSAPKPVRGTPHHRAADPTPQHPAGADEPVKAAAPSRVTVHSVYRHITTRSQGDLDRLDGRPLLLRHRVGGSPWPQPNACAPGVPPAFSGHTQIEVNRASQSTNPTAVEGREAFAMRRSGVRIPSAPLNDEGPDTLLSGPSSFSGCVWGNAVSPAETLRARGFSFVIPTLPSCACPRRAPER
jgi:hypothetical protein